MINILLKKVKKNVFTAIAKVEGHTHYYRISLNKETFVLIENDLESSSAFVGVGGLNEAKIRIANLFGISKVA